MQESAFVLALFVALYVITLALERLLFRHPPGTASLQALSVGFPTATFLGSAILAGLYGSSSAVTVAIAAHRLQPAPDRPDPGPARDRLRCAGRHIEGLAGGIAAQHRRYRALRDREDPPGTMNSLYRRILVIAGVLIATALIVLLMAAGVLFGYARIAQNRAAAELHPFYNPPDPLAAGEPGEIIRVAAIDAPDGVKAWRVLYHSTTYDGRDVPVSALVVVPDQPAPSGGFPVVSVAHGTVGMARTCAPSLLPFQRRTLTQGSFFTVMVKPFTDAGYAVTATDYQGLGTPRTNPYLVGEDAGRNVLDAARMSRALPDLELSDETLIWGHSQGGQAAAFAGQLAPSYAPNLDILGVITGSPAAELGMIADEVAQLRKRSLLTGLMVMIVRAWSTAYPDLDPGSVLTPVAIQSMGILDQDCIGGVLLAYILYPAPDYIKPNATMTPPLPELIDENTPGATRTPAPILVFQGESDPLIRPQFTQAFVRRLCSAGNTVSLNMYPGKGHLSVIAPSMPDTLAWMSDRLAQKPAASSC